MRAVFANPFSDERIAVDLEIAGSPPSVSYEERLRRLIQTVSVKIIEVTEEGKGDIRKFAGNDRTLIEYGFLFHVYHQFIDAFDRLIQDQLAAGDTPCKAPFADDAIRMMVRFGFSAEDAVRYFALFFQMRRAFYFINQSIVGRSPCMKQLRLHLWNNVFSEDILLYASHLWNRMEDYSTMLLGETGTGKGVAAAAIGRSGFIPFDEKNICFRESFTRAFVSLNLSQFPEQLLESELFGHMKGAFTGAVSTHEGIFSRCSPHGAILLDEIGEVSIPVQIKLLQVLQDRVFSPVGSHQKHRFHGRVIAATNRSVSNLRSEGVFRDDFYYRLCSDIISVPPLRLRLKEDPEEIDDILMLIMKRILGKPSPELAGKVRDTIQKQLPKDYAWPGNVRELEQCARRIILKSCYETDTQGMSAVDTATKFVSGIEEGLLNAQELLSGYCELLYNRHGTYEAVARLTALDRRTVKRYLAQQEKSS